VFAPRPDDAHQDHRLIAELAPTVWRDALILHYEIPKWDGDLGAPNFFVRLEEGHARAKVAILLECFATQSGKRWFDEETFVGLMRLRGMECSAVSRRAEAFYARKAAL